MLFPRRAWTFTGRHFESRSSSRPRSASSAAREGAAFAAATRLTCRAEPARVHRSLHRSCTAAYVYPARCSATGQRAFAARPDSSGVCPAWHPAALIGFQVPRRFAPAAGGEIRVSASPDPRVVCRFRFSPGRFRRTIGRHKMRSEARPIGIYRNGSTSGLHSCIRSAPPAARGPGEAILPRTFLLLQVWARA